MSDWSMSDWSMSGRSMSGRSMSDCPTCGVGFVLPSGFCNHCNGEVVPRVLVLKGETKLTVAEAKQALDEAMQIIEAVGTTGIYSRYHQAHEWMRKYYPNWA